ncbi:DUF3180 domain-containing protein [Saccharothrix violaceirubra]|uniref:DUF3180 domain-containing protein n=1 Tax=Saccharothrix violaceirubra TaxID=413306 RepID=A0A7W7WZI8_9PSEU|nr:DUF3180 domain-containing protein [Saccharothrix violaceirubra]MBB4968883.1 hypothetical protein [Saccharothrix violaceirubra]
MRFTRPRDLLAVALLAGLVAHALLNWVYDTLPPLPTFAGFTLLVIAATDLALAFPLRARIRRVPGTRPVAPLTAARAVVLAKASSVLGAMMGGAWAGALLYVLPVREEFDAAGHDVVSALVGLGCAAALVGAGLWLEHCCKTPDDSRGES